MEEPEADRSSELADGLSQQTTQAAERARQQADKMNAELEARMASIEGKAKKASTSYVKAGTKPEASKVEAGSGRGLGIGMAVASSILGLPIGLFAIGWFIETMGGSPNIKTWLGLTGAILGILHGAWLAQKLQQ